MRRDSHAGTDGRYQIVSLYFDNCCDKALREKQDGINRREKFRLRRYNDDCSALFLEKKQKVNGLCLKTGCRIPQDVCIRLLSGEPDWLPPDGHPLLQELDFQMKSQLLRPKTLVRYLWEPYVYEAGNVRITFDMALQSGLAGIRFLDPKAVCTGHRAGTHGTGGEIRRVFAVFHRRCPANRPYPDRRVFQIRRLPEI